MDMLRFRNCEITKSLLSLTPFGLQRKDNLGIIVQLNSFHYYTLLTIIPICGF